MIDYIKSFIKTFFSSPEPINFMESDVEPPKKKASKPKKGVKKKVARRMTNGKATYPYWTTPIGGSFRMRSLMAGSIYKRLQNEGITYSQRKIKNGYLAIRKS
jgi:hypothetical protein